MAKSKRQQALEILEREFSPNAALAIWEAIQVYTRPKKSTDPSPGALTWNAYVEAYQGRYRGVAPAANPKVRSICSRLVQYVGEEKAPLLARFYLGQNDQWLIVNRHPLEALLKNYQKYLTMMDGGGGPGTSGQARGLAAGHATAQASQSYLERKGVR